MDPNVTGDYLARLDGATDPLWEPLWQRHVALQPVERALLTCPVVRRLHFIHHAGAAYLSTPHTYSRLQHTLGVFALTVRFSPDNALLRAAALLHDVGHFPFSHTLEQIPQIDHHHWTRERVLSAPVADILEQHRLDPPAVLAHIEGAPANPLRNRDNILQLDHLDSWVRSALAGGILPVRPARLLARLAARGGYIDMDVKTAELLVALIVAEARFHCSAANLGANTMLKRLVEEGLEAGLFSVAALARMTDTELEQRLRESPVTAAQTRRLWNRPADIVAGRLEVGDEPPPAAYLVSVDRLYLAAPLAGGRPVAEISPQAEKLLAEARRLTGTYAVSWAG